MSKNPGSQNDAKPLGDKRFAAMTFGEKLTFVGKALVFLVSGGFIFPTLWTD